MVGYLKPNFKKMPIESKKIYKSFYCGLCKSLKKHYGYIGITSLNYEITSFLILMNGLTSEKNIFFHGSCTVSPFVPVTYLDYLSGDFMYAATISLLVANYEIKDNLIDDGGIKWRIINNIIKRKHIDYIFFSKEHYQKIDRVVSDFYKMEKEKNHTFYEMVDCSGDMVEYLIAPLILAHITTSRSSLLRLSNLIGQWIYLIDACDDYVNDFKNGRFNPLNSLCSFDNLDDIFRSIEEQITHIIKNLPIIKNRDLIEFLFIRNISEIRQTILLKFNQQRN